MSEIGSEEDFISSMVSSGPSNGGTKTIPIIIGIIITIANWNTTLNNSIMII